MLSIDEFMNYKVDIDGLPDRFPTHKHDAAFWESLGRAVATFGFLEEVLGKAIFALTATKKYDETELQEAYNEWLPKLERALTDPLGGLIESYGKAVRDNPDIVVVGLEELLDLLRKASGVRNVLCHGSWGPPNENGASLPLFVNRQKMIFESPIDRKFIDQVQQHATELACEV